MKVILISDSHGNKNSIDKIFNNLQFDYLFFLGDGLGDLGTYINLDNVFAVSGNCDFFSRVENEKFFELAGYKIFITHGNKYGVKSTLNHLQERGEELNANIVVFGHTHKKYFEKIGDIYYINPGKFSKNTDGDSCGVELTLDENGVEVKDFVI